MRLSINHTSVNISSPTKFPSNHSVYCSWKVNVPSGFSIKIHFSSFDLQNSTNCSQEAVEIFVSRGLYLNIALGRYCGDLVPDDLFRNDFDVTVTYTAVPSGTRPKHPGFRASITLEAAGEKIYPTRDRWFTGSDRFSHISLLEKNVAICSQN